MLILKGSRCWCWHSMLSSDVAHLFRCSQELTEVSHVNVTTCPSSRISLGLYSDVCLNLAIVQIYWINWITFTLLQFLLAIENTMYANENFITVTTFTTEPSEKITCTYIQSITIAILTEYVELQWNSSAIDYIYKSMKLITTNALHWPVQLQSWRMSLETLVTHKD